MTTRTIIVSAVLLALAIAGGIHFYPQWDLKRFNESLPFPPKAQETPVTDAPLPVLTSDAPISTRREPVTSTKEVQALPQEAIQVEREEQQAILHREQAALQERIHQLAERLGLPANQPVTIEALEIEVQKRETTVANVLTMRNVQRDEAWEFAAWFRDNAAKMNQLHAEVEFILVELPHPADSPNAMKAFIAAVPDVEERRYYINRLLELQQIFREYRTRFTNLSTPVRDVVRQALAKQQPGALNLSALEAAIREYFPENN